MPKRDMKSALTKSLRAETDAVATRVPSFNQRAERADTIFGADRTAPTGTPVTTIKPTHQPEPAEKAKEGGAVRDTFSMSRTEYEMIDILRARCAKQGRFANRSEITRAGIVMLSRLTDTVLLDAVGAVPAMTRGPSKKQA